MRCSTYTLSLSLTHTTKWHKCTANDSFSLSPSLSVCVCVCVCVLERERERERYISFHLIGPSKRCEIIKVIYPIFSNSVSLFVLLFFSYRLEATFGNGAAIMEKTVFLLAYSNSLVMPPLLLLLLLPINPEQGLHNL
jgi:hypothetical protein